jgi:hypothetical protein
MRVSEYGVGESEEVPEIEESRADDERLSEIREMLRQHLEFITKLGIQVKDLDTGLIDFPTMRDGEEVLLCWRLGEPNIACWHTYEDGYMGRRPI